MRDSNTNIGNEIEMHFLQVRVGHATEAEEDGLPCNPCLILISQRTHAQQSERGRRQSFKMYRTEEMTNPRAAHEVPNPFEKKMGDSANGELNTANPLYPTAEWNEDNPFF